MPSRCPATGATRPTLPTRRRPGHARASETRALFRRGFPSGGASLQAGLPFRRGFPAWLNVPWSQVATPLHPTPPSTTSESQGPVGHGGGGIDSVPPRPPRPKVPTPRRLRADVARPGTAIRVSRVPQDLRVSCAPGSLAAGKTAGDRPSSPHPPSLPPSLPLSRSCLGAGNGSALAGSRCL